MRFALYIYTTSCKAFWWRLQDFWLLAAGLGRLWAINCWADGQIQLVWVRRGGLHSGASARICANSRKAPHQKGCTQGVCHARLASSSRIGWGKLSNPSLWGTHLATCRGDLSAQLCLSSAYWGAELLNSSPFPHQSYCCDNAKAVRYHNHAWPQPGDKILVKVYACSTHSIAAFTLQYAMSQSGVCWGEVQKHLRFLDPCDFHAPPFSMCILLQLTWLLCDLKQTGAGRFWVRKSSHRFPLGVCFLQQAIFSPSCAYCFLWAG